MSALYVLSILCFANALGEEISPEPLRAEHVLADIRAHGARAIVDNLWADRIRWDEAMKKISRGSAGWLDVAVALRPGTDGGPRSYLTKRSSSR